MKGESLHESPACLNYSEGFSNILFSRQLSLNGSRKLEGEGGEEGKLENCDCNCEIQLTGDLAPELCFLCVRMHAKGEINTSSKTCHKSIKYPP